MTTLLNVSPGTSPQETPPVLLMYSTHEPGHGRPIRKDSDMVCFRTVEHLFDRSLTYEQFKSFLVKTLIRCDPGTVICLSEVVREPTTFTFFVSFKDPKIIRSFERRFCGV